MNKPLLIVCAVVAVVLGWITKDYLTCHGWEKMPNPAVSKAGFGLLWFAWLMFAYAGATWKKHAKPLPFPANDTRR